MSVYQRHRHVSEYEFFHKALEIRVEVNRLMVQESAVPKRYRLTNAVPTIETARSIVFVMRPCRDSITRERRKLKKQAELVRQGKMTMEQVERSYQSWRGGMKRLDAHKTVITMDALYHDLFKDLAGGGRS